MGVFIFKTVEIRFVCKNHAFQSSLLFHLRTFLSTGNFFKIEVLEYSLIVTCTLLVSETVCVGIMLQSTAGWKHSPAKLSRVNPHVIFYVGIHLRQLLTWGFNWDKQAKQISTQVTSNVVHQALQVLSTLQCSTTPDICSSSSAAP